MYCLEVTETYQRTITSRVYKNFEVARYYKDIEELKENIENMERELSRMDIVDISTAHNDIQVSRRFEYHRPGRIGTLLRTITVRRYNPPKKAELI